MTTKTPYRQRERTASEKAAALSVAGQVARVLLNTDKYEADVANIKKAKGKTAAKKTRRAQGC